MEIESLKLLEKICECQTTCKYCFNACLEEKDVHMMTRCIKLNVECAEVCGLTISSLAYESEFSAEVLKLCIHACEKCAEECGKHQYIHCIECAKACRECAEACQAYLNRFCQAAA